MAHRHTAPSRIRMLMHAGLRTGTIVPISVRTRRTIRTGAAVIISALTLAACTSKADTSQADTTAVAPAPAPATSEVTAVRGTISAVSDTSITVETPSGPQTLHIEAPLKVYARNSSDLAHVTPNAFVGITSVAQPDGSERATEIHVFPEELRGTGEGSRMMEQAAGGDSSSKMTNGAVAKSRMTNGSVANSGDAKAGGKSAGSRMTNGNVAQTGGGTKYTVQYPGGTQTIDIPAGVTVTLIAPTDTKLTTGANVIVLARMGVDGKLSASGVMLAGAPDAKK
jgi:hypothetical protein